MAEVMVESGTARPEQAARSASYVNEDAGWLRGASGLTLVYMVAGLMLVGVPGISRAAIVVSLLCALWAGYGLVTRKARFPLVLAMPTLFYVMVVISGLFVDPYPVVYIGQVTTVWLAAISIGIFVANGMALSPILIGFALVFAGNALAIFVGYDGYQVNIASELGSAAQEATQERSGALAGQPNLLMALTIAPLMVMFLRRRRIGVLTWLALTVAAVWISVMSGSRSGLIPAAMFFIFAGFLLLKNSYIRKLMPVLLGVLALAWLVQSLEPNLLLRLEKSPIGDTIVVQRMIQAIDGTEGSSIERKDLIERAKVPFASKPVFGHGPDQFQKLVGQGTYSHNTYAEISVNFGLVGLVLWFGMYALAAWGVFRSPYKLPALCTILMLLAMDQTFVGYLERPLVLVMCLLLAFTGRSLIRRSRRAFLDDAPAGATP